MRQINILKVLLIFAFTTALHAYEMRRDRPHDCNRLRRPQDVKRITSSNHRIVLRIAEDEDKFDDDDNANIKVGTSDNDVNKIDLNKLSDKQMLQLLQLVQSSSKGGNGGGEGAMNENTDEETTAWIEELSAVADDGDRGTKWPWKKVQRIIYRHLIKIPKRYLKKFLRQLGLGRSQLVRTINDANGDDVWLLQTSSTQPVGFLVHGSVDNDREIVELKGNLLGDNYVFPLNR